MSLSLCSLKSHENWRGSGHSGHSVISITARKQRIAVLFETVDKLVLTTHEKSGAEPSAKGQLLWRAYAAAMLEGGEKVQLTRIYIWVI